MSPTRSAPSVSDHHGRGNFFSGAVIDPPGGARRGYPYIHKVVIAICTQAHILKQP